MSSSQHHNNEFSMTIKTNFELPLHKLHIALTLQTSVITTNIASYLHCGPPVMRPHDSLRRQGLAITDQADYTVYLLCTCCELSVLIVHMHMYTYFCKEYLFDLGFHKTIVVA